MSHTDSRVSSKRVFCNRCSCLLNTAFTMTVHVAWWPVLTAHVCSMTWRAVYFFIFLFIFTFFDISFSYESYMKINVSLIPLVVNGGCVYLRSFASRFLTGLVAFLPPPLLGSGPSSNSLRQTGQRDTIAWLWHSKHLERILFLPIPKWTFSLCHAACY